MAGDIFTLDADNNAAVRTVGVKAGAAETNSPIIFTKDADGNAAVRVMGGAGSIDEDRIIIKSAEIPAASEDELGKFYCFSGETNANYTHGYIYECVAGSSYYEANIAFDHSTFASEDFYKAGQLIVDAGVADPTEVTGGTMTYALAGNLWSIIFTDANGNALNAAYSIYTDDLEQNYDILPTVDPSEFVDGQVVNMAINNVVEHVDYSWERLDVQPVAKLGRYLSGWNCATGLAVTNPQESPYEYTTGDYFIVKTVAAGGATNYRPDGSSYVIGQASTTVETSVVSVGDTYLYDGTSWTLLKTGSTVTSVNSKTGEVVLDATDVGALPLTGGTLTGGVTVNIPQDAPTGTSQLTFNIMSSSIPTQIISTCTLQYKYLLGVSTLGIGSSIAVGGDILRLSGSDGTIGNATLRWKAICVKKIINSNTKAIEVPEDVGGTMAVMNTPSTMPELTVAGWDLNALTGKYEQSVLVDCVTATNNVIISPAPASIDEYLDAGVVCVGQSNGRLSFEADSLPNSAVTVNLICFN